MADRARVSSLDALESFRADLIVFLGKARVALDDASDDIRRTRLWVQSEQRTKWEGELRRRRKILDQAEQELLAARISSLRDTKSGQQMAVNKARRAVAEAEDRIRAVKRWGRDFEHAVEQPVRRIESLRGYLGQDLPKAITYLVQVLRTLDAYAETHAKPAPKPSADQEGDANP